MEKLYTLGTLLCAAILVAMLCFVRGVRAETTPVCANPQDVYEMAAVYAMGGDIWGVKVSQGKCARISESVSYVRTMDKFPFRGQEMLIVQYATGTWPSGTLYGIIDKVPEEQVMEVTYKPEYGDTSALRYSTGLNPDISKDCATKKAKRGGISKSADVATARTVS